MDDFDIDEIIGKLKANDVDAKIDAVNKLHQALESSVEITDTDGLADALKACLRSSNQHLTAATLSTLPTFFRLLTTGTQDGAGPPDAATLRHALTVFLPAGGLVDKLGDGRDRAREKARESLVLMGCLSFRCGNPSLQSTLKQKDAGKGQETPLQIWERFLKEGGLQSKVWRVREQAILVLVHVRRTYHNFPLRPYLPLLVELLEDTDGVVRECSRESVVELFTGPSVTDAARADLKKEMSKKSVRKTIVDSILQRLMSSSGSGSTLSTFSTTMSDAGSENGEAPKKVYIPPSMKLKRSESSAQSTGGVSRTFSQSTINTLSESTSSRPSSRLGVEMPPTPTTDQVDIQPVFIASSKDLENEFARMLKYFEGRETEQNWSPREQSVLRIRGMLKGDAHLRYHEAFIAGLKNGILDATLKTLASLRTTVSINTCGLYTELAMALGTNLDPFYETLLTNLLRLASLTKKIAAAQSQQVVTTILTQCTPPPKLVLNLLWVTMQDKNTPARAFAVNHIKAYLEAHGKRLQHVIESQGALDSLEKSIKKGLSDANPGVREVSRAVFWIFEGIWKDRGEAIFGTLDNPARKQLEKACPIPGAIASAPPKTPAARKSSVAAAIAASRAKAKAIATAPPTLRHQATSTSQILNSSLSQRPLSPSTSSNSFIVTRRSPSTSSRPISPASPTRRVVSLSPNLTSPKAFSVATSAPMHTRSKSAESAPVGLPPATISHARKPSFGSSPPSSPKSVFSTAVKPALPVSPPPRPRAASPRLTSPSSPTRIPSPTRGLGIRRSLASAVTLANQKPSTIEELQMKYPGNEESLLLAQAIPLPDDSGSDDEYNMMSFSAPYERFQTLSQSKTETSSLSAGSPPLNAPEAVVNDMLRAKAEQAESAADRLLELVEPDDDTTVSPIPASLLPTTNANGSAIATKPEQTKSPTVLTSKVNLPLPMTPPSKRTVILRQAAAFKDSPVQKRSTTLLDMLRERKNETGWWLKRMNLIDRGGPLKEGDPAARLADLKRYVASLERGTADVSTLKKLALLSMGTPVKEDSLALSTSTSFPSTPSPRGNSIRLGTPNLNIWREERLFDHLFNALMSFLHKDKTEEELEYALIVLWELLENQAPLVEGRESDVFNHLLHVRYCNRANILEATNTIRDALVALIEPVYGLTTLHASLRTFVAEDTPAYATEEMKSASYAFGLVALGKFILRLPAMVLEDELPRLKMTLTTALSDASSLVVRESAAACIVASQVVLRDETHLFTLLDGLADEKKNLLTYLFDKHGARGTSPTSGAEKVEKELRRLDGRTNTPPRPKVIVKSGE